jgi:hypothetical protein
MTDETGWLVEDGGGLAQPRYRTMDKTGIHWTVNVHDAIRFARRADAEMFAAGDKGAWRIMEHMWCDPLGDKNLNQARLRVRPTVEELEKLLAINPDAPIEITTSGEVVAKGLGERIRAALNTVCAENGSNTPDFILAEYLISYLCAYERAVNERERWYGRMPVEIHVKPRSELLDRVAEQAIRFDRCPLALISHCVLCGEHTESMSLHRMEPPTRHTKTCVLYGYEPKPGADGA